MIVAGNSDSVFAGRVPKIYDEYFVPLIFQQYAADIAARVSAFRPSRVLEIACGTGIVTRSLAESLSHEVEIVATDLNQPMLDFAAGRGTKQHVEWRQADALQLPFKDETFDAVVCQFGVMFFPDKPRAFAEAERVLKRGGAYVFNTWDRIEDNEFADIVTDSLAAVFPDDPPRFMARTPHGYHDVDTVRADLEKGGFRSARIDTVAHRSRADSPRIPAVAYCHGTPLRDEIVARDPMRLDDATTACEKAIAARFGNGAVDSKIQAHIIEVRKS